MTAERRYQTNLESRAFYRTTELGSLPGQWAGKTNGIKDKNVICNVQTLPESGFEQNTTGDEWGYLHIDLALYDIKKSLLVLLHVTIGLILL